MKKNYVIMNKRYSVGTIMLLILFTILFLIDGKNAPVVFPIVLITLIFWTIRLLVLPRCKALEITDEHLIIYGYRKKSGYKIKYDIELDSITKYYVSSIGGIRSRINVYVIYVGKKRIVLKPIAFGWKNDGLINYSIEKIKRILNKIMKERLGEKDL